MKTTKKLMIYKLTAVISELDNKVHEIILLAKNEEEARSNAELFDYHFHKGNSVRCYEIGIPTKNILNNGALKSPYLNIVSVHIEGQPCISGKEDKRLTKKEIIKKAIEDRFSACPQYIINYLVEYYIESLGRDCACEMIEKSPYLCMDCISVLQGEIFRIQKKEKE